MYVGLYANVQRTKHPHIQMPHRPICMHPCITLYPNHDPHPKTRSSQTVQSRSTNANITDLPVIPECNETARGKNEGLGTRVELGGLWVSANPMQMQRNVWLL